MYTTIYIYETKFQKSIINFLINQNYFNNERSLIIDATSHKIKVNDKIYDINFNRIDKLFSSIRGLRLLKKEEITCETLVSTHITGINALFLSSFFVSKQKILIDDGIGTPVLLQNRYLFKWKINFQARFILSKFLLFLNELELKNVQNNYKTIDSYYTVYPNILENSHHFSIFYLDGFYNRNYRIIYEKTCFIGAPLIEFDLISVKKYKNLLKRVHGKYGDFTYYLHPDEYWVKSFNLKGVEFKKNKESIEEHFYKKGIPSTIIGFASSALLNLANSDDLGSKIKFRYIKQRVYGKMDALYYSILESHKIKDSHLNL